MKRDNFVTSQHQERPVGPDVVPNQVWKADAPHDFGNGPVEYSLKVNFQNPVTKIWICSFVYSATMSISFNGRSLFQANLTQEQIQKNFTFVSVQAPGTANQQWNPNPNQPIWQYIPNQPNWIVGGEPMLRNNGGMNGNSVFDNMTYATNHIHAIGNTTAAVGSNLATGFYTVDAVSGAQIPTAATV